jgi:hypothetical protein
MKKRGQSMSTNTIVLLILALIVLVVLVIGFIFGWNKVLPWVSKSNVDSIQNSCSSACSTNSVYDFCSVQRDLKTGVRGESKIEATCAVFSTEPTLFNKYKVEKCDIDCKTACEQITINGIKGDKTLTTGTYNVGALSTEGTCFINLI